MSISSIFSHLPPAWSQHHRVAHDMLRRMQNRNANSFGVDTRYAPIPILMEFCVLDISYWARSHDRTSVFFGYAEIDVFDSIAEDAEKCTNGKWVGSQDSVHCGG
jgi:hypothetical protein